MASHSRSRPPGPPRRKTRLRLLRALRAAPVGLQLVVGVSLVVILWATVNWMYQAIRKPSEVFFPVSNALLKTPRETWREYESLFREHATPVITAELLAALAQVEGEGNPVSRTYWRWRLTPNPFEWYRPASSAAGMYQMTNAAFGEAKRYCIHDHAVVEDGPWHDAKSCWFNSLYTRVLPSHAIELAAAWLDHSVATVLKLKPVPGVTLQQKQDLAAVIHLCGLQSGEAYVRRHFRLSSPQQRCGDHDVRSYLARVNTNKRLFTQLPSST
jgi:hypothetical protein